MKFQRLAIRRLLTFSNEREPAFGFGVSRTETYHEASEGKTNNYSMARDPNPNQNRTKYR
jgi:hypothetical protein